MLLSIPVLDLLHSQLDIGVDPSSGKLTCNIKDISSRPRQCRSSHAGDLALTLQSSSEDSNFGTLCIRISPSQVAFSEHSLMNMSEVSRFGQGSLEAITNQTSLWASLQEQVPQQFDEHGAMSPFSQALSLMTSDSIIEDLKTYSSPGIYPFSDPQFDATGIQVDHTRYPRCNATYPNHCPPDPVHDMVDIHDQPDVERNAVSSAPCGSFSIMDPFTFEPHSELLSHTSSAAASPNYNQITLESDTSTPSHRNDEAYPTPSSSRGDSPTGPSREGKRGSFPCPYPSCGRILKSMYTQQIHLKAHEGKPQKSFTCTMGCSESFTRHHDRLRHEVTQHGKKCEFSCKQCERFFSSQRMLDRHTCWSWRNGSLRWQLKDFPDSLHSET